MNSSCSATLDVERYFRELRAARCRYRRVSFTPNVSIFVLPAPSVSFAESFAVAPSNALQAAATFFAAAFFGHSFSVFALPAATRVVSGMSL